MLAKLAGYKDVCRRERRERGEGEAGVAKASGRAIQITGDLHLSKERRFPEKTKAVAGSPEH